MRSDLWTREQLILALNLYWKTPYNKISGSSNNEIIESAKIIGKTPAAIAYMLMNFTALDRERQDEGKIGKRPPGKLAVELWEEYLNKWEKLSDESFKILSKFDKKLITKESKIEIEYKNTEGLEKERLVKIRVNQSDFRQRILASYNKKCCITGLDIPALLVASHIIPWAENNEQRLNPQNGLCLNSIHDKAFDRGLITISTDNFTVKLSKEILKRKKEESIQHLFLKYENQSIILPDRYKPDPNFLYWHHINRFEK
jgi:putative restriction endonuclease